jgi:hypothetical protein
MFRQLAADVKEAGWHSFMDDNTVMKAVFRPSQQVTEELVQTTITYGGLRDPVSMSEEQSCQ